MTAATPPSPTTPTQARPRRRRDGPRTLTAYDVVLINSSGGKDSQAMLSHLVQRADREGLDHSRIVVAHADMGRMEWPGTHELAAEHAAAYDLRFEIVRRPQGDLLDHIAERGMFPSAATRYCTSQHKTGQIHTLMTRLAREHRAAGHPGPTRILNCLGLRADESPARALKTPFGPDPRASTQTTRHVDRWLPLHHWNTADVWAEIHRSGLRWHHAYDLGMTRLSCCLCVLASDRDLLIGARHNPDLAQQIIDLEQTTGHTFQHRRSMTQIRAVAHADNTPTPPATGPHGRPQHLPAGEPPPTDDDHQRRAATNTSASTD